MMEHPSQAKHITVAIQGGPGAFHEMAARKFFIDQQIDILPCETFEDLFYELREGTVDCGMVAIENSVAGSILPNYALLRESGLRIAGDVYLRIIQHVMALPGQRMEDIREIHSHPVAIQQCNIFLETLRRKGVKIVETTDTAMSAKWIKDNATKGIGAIASQQAAELYGLEILVRGVEADKANFTRFLLISANERVLLPNYDSEDHIDKASVCFSLPHATGSLSQVLSVLAFYNMNLSKIQSIPIVGKAWEYFFLVDLLFADFQRYRQAIDAIRPLTDHLEILGEYKHGDIPEPEKETD